MTGGDACSPRWWTRVRADRSAGAVGQREAHHHAIERHTLHFFDGFRNGTGFDDGNRFACQQRVNALTQGRIVFHDEHLPHALRRTRLELANGAGEFIALARFERIADCTEMGRDIRVIGDGDDLSRSRAFHSHARPSMSSA